MAVSENHVWKLWVMKELLRSANHSDRSKQAWGNFALATDDHRKDNDYVVLHNIKTVQYSGLKTRDRYDDKCCHIVIPTLWTKAI